MDGGRSADVAHDEQEHAPCDLCGSLDFWVTPAGATLCRVCGDLRRTQKEQNRIDDIFAPDWWSMIDPHERLKMMATKDRFPCVCCRGITNHGSHCAELQAEWYRMPFGKFRDRPMQVVDSQYLEFVVRRRIGPADFRAVVEQELARRGRKVFSASEENALENDTGGSDD